MTIYYGIDPGKHGAIAAVTNGQLLWVEDMPNIANDIAVPLLMNIATQDTLGVAAIERVHAMPKQGVSSSFNFGKSYGIALGVFGAVGHQVIHPTPTEWKKTFALNGKPKDAARLLAIETWPTHADLFKRKKDLDRAEAALIARHAEIVTPLSHREAA